MNRERTGSEKVKGKEGHKETIMNGITGKIGVWITYEGKTKVLTGYCSLHL